MEKRMLQNRYQLLEKIGDGGTAVVYKARCVLLDRIVAVKVLKDELARDHAFVRKFRSEAQAAAQLSHPNIVNVYDVGEEDGLYFIVMEFIEGTSLKEYIEARAPLSPDEAVRIASLICDALEQAHSKGIIHRDIKPHNVLITNEGSIKIADFGIARAPSSSTITYSGNIMGSVHYISPEQARGTSISATTDIYSLGCLLYEMLTGKVPFDAESPVTVVLKHIHEEPVPPRTLNEAIPSALEKIVLIAMAKDPVNRFGTAAEMKEALISLTPPSRRFVKKGGNDHTMVVPSVSGEGDDEELPGKRKRMKPMGKLILIVALIGLIAGMSYGLRDQIFGKEVIVPKVEGLSAREAYNTLVDNKLKMTKIGEEYNSEVEADHVVAQDPAEGKKVKEGREVKVILSKGPELVRVPKLVGQSLFDAEMDLKKVGLQLGDTQKIYDDRVPEGEIITQEPRADRELATGGKVDVTVSRGPRPNQIQVPNLVGSYLEEAKSRLEEKKLVPGNVARKDSNEYFAEQVISHDPKGGLMVGEGEQVSLVVSKGPGPLPGVTPLSFKLPEQGGFYQVVVTVTDVKGQRDVHRNLYQAGDAVSLQVSYYGKALIEVYVNDELFKKYNV